MCVVYIFFRKPFSCPRRYRRYDRRSARTGTRSYILHGVLLLLLWRPTAILFVIQRYATPWASLKHTRAQFVISPKKKKILLVKMKQKQKKKNRDTTTTLRVYYKNTFLCVCVYKIRNIICISSIHTRTHGLYAARTHNI